MPDGRRRRAFGAKEELGVERDAAQLNSRIEEIFNEARTNTLGLLSSIDERSKNPLRLE